MFWEISGNKMSETKNKDTNDVNLKRVNGNNITKN